MPRYYFDVTDARGFHRDDQGDDLRSFEDAQTQCQMALHDIARDELPDGELRVIACDVRNEADRVVYRARITYEGTQDPV